jgi:hypothetical protein
VCHSLPAAAPASLPTVPAAAAAAAAVTAAALHHPQSDSPAAAVAECDAAAVVVVAANGVRAVSVVAAGQALCYQPVQLVLQGALVLPDGWQSLPCAAALQSCHPASAPAVCALF